MNTLIKNTATFIATITLSIAAISSANAATEHYAADDQASSKICVAATTGSKFKLGNAIDNAQVDKKFVVKSVKCNGQDILSFVAANGKNVNKVSNFLTQGKFNDILTVAKL